MPQKLDKDIAKHMPMKSKKYKNYTEHHLRQKNMKVEIKHKMKAVETQAFGNQTRYY